MNGFKNSFLEKLNSFSQEDRKIFDRIYSVWESKGIIVPPKEMIPWIEQIFGNINDVINQDFVKITNKITYEGAVFNELRTMRPVVGESKMNDLYALIESNNNGPFSTPLTMTPEDVFGRIKGQYCITAANVAKYDGMHGLIIFDDHNPLLFSRKRVRDYFNVAKQWFTKAHEAEPKAVYPLFTWNCLWKAAASVIHGHCQLVLTENMAYAKVEEHRYLSLKYQEEHRRSYSIDKYIIHDKLGLALERNGIKIIAKITPIKEKEIEIYSDKFDDNLADMVSDVLNTFKETLGVVSFNLVIILPPMAKTVETWSHMPIIVKIVDRGSLSNKTADIGVMELYAQSAVGSNPYLIIEKLKAALL